MSSVKYSEYHLYKLGSNSFGFIWLNSHFKKQIIILGLKVNFNVAIYPVQVFKNMSTNYMNINTLGIVLQIKETQERKWTSIPNTF